MLNISDYPRSFFADIFHTPPLPLYYLTSLSFFAPMEAANKSEKGFVS